MHPLQHSKTVTVFIPAYNEEKNIADAVASAILAAQDKVDDYEILVLNACSADRTGMIADQLAAENDKIKVIHRKEWHGLGANYMYGARQAAMEYFVLFPGDNEITGDSLAKSLAMIGQTEMIIPYTTNMEVRAFHRRLISKAFVLLLNTLFNLKLQYYNGNTVYKTSMLKELSIHSEDFAYNAEILIKLIKTKHSYAEIGMEIKPITNKTAIFNTTNMFGVLKTVIRLFYDINIKERHKYR